MFLPIRDMMEVIMLITCPIKKKFSLFLGLLLGFNNGGLGGIRGLPGELIKVSILLLLLKTLLVGRTFVETGAQISKSSVEVSPGASFGSINFTFRCKFECFPWTM